MTNEDVIEPTTSPEKRIDKALDVIRGMSRDLEDEVAPSMSGMDALIVAADQALYQAKAQGRNRWVCWSPPLSAKAAAE
jgi:GGDEF domain-containing protein